MYEAERDRAIALFHEGYNCTQSVLLTFADEVGLEKAQAARLACSFGAGMGKLREVCGALSAVFMIAGLAHGWEGPETGEPKARHYALIQGLGERFRQTNGSLLCRDLLEGCDPAGGHVPQERTETYYKIRPCERIIGEAAQMAAEVLAKK